MWCGLPDVSRVRAHEWLSAVWLVLTLATTGASVLWPENTLMIPWLIFMSGYAISSTHWAAREGAAPSEEERP